MTLLKALLLGIVQGITEFLPVSSSGHLVLLQNWFEVGNPPIVFDVMLHVATLMAVVVMFRAEITRLLRTGLGESVHALRNRGKQLKRPAGDVRYILFLSLGTIVTGLIGLAFEDSFEAAFSSPRAVGVALILTGLLLLGSRFAGRRGCIENIDRVLWWQVVIIGLAQGAAVMPGLSRSGTTIVASLLLGLEKRFAVEFSFLLSIPIILAVAAKELLGGGHAVFSGSFLVGMLAAFVVGYLSLYLLRRFVIRGKLHLFSLYCIPVGVVVSFIYWMPW